MVLPRSPCLPNEGPPVNVEVPPEAPHDDVVVPGEAVDEGLVEHAIKVLGGAHVARGDVPGNVDFLAGGFGGFELGFEPLKLTPGVADAEIGVFVALVVNVGVEGDKTKTGMN